MSNPESRLAYLFPGCSVFPKISMNSEPRSRLCEITWVDEETFGPKIVAVTESLYGDLSRLIGQVLRPGMLGEQLVFTQPIRYCSTIKIGDARFELLDRADMSSLSTNDDILSLWAYKLRLVEDGLVEPGAPVIAICE